MKGSSIFGFTFRIFNTIIIFIIIFSSSLLFFSYSNPTSLNTIAYGSSSSPSSLSGQNQQLIDKIAIKITEAKPSADYVSVKKVLETLALQKQNTGGNAQESLTKIFNQVSQNPKSIVADNIANLALQESASNTQQQPPSNTQQQNQVTPSYNTTASSNVKNPFVPTENEQEQEQENITDALVKKGNTLSDLGRNDEAIQYYNKALQIDPNQTLALNSKGEALYMLDKYDEAIQHYDKALQIDTNDTDALFNKGLALNNLDRNDEAIPYFDQVLQIDPNYTLVLDLKNTALSRLDR